jgi:hypothetical protein
VKAARELRDRWMEAIQSGQLVIQSKGKYNPGRMIEAPSNNAPALQTLPAPMAA